MEDSQRDSNGDGIGDRCDPLCGGVDPPRFCEADPRGFFDDSGTAGPGPAPAPFCLGGEAGCDGLPVLNPLCFWDDRCAGEPGEDYLDVFDGRGDRRLRVSGSDLGLSGDLGPAIASIPDSDGDGLRDIAFGSPTHRECEPDVGCADETGLVVAIGSRSGLELWRWTSGGEHDEAGAALVGLGDLLLVGAPGARDAAGRATGAVIVLDVVATPRIVATHLGEQGGDRYGASLASIGDRDADGVGDGALIGAPLAGPSSRPRAGRIYAVTPIGDVFATFDGPTRDARMGEASTAVLPRSQHPSGVFAGIPDAASGRGTVLLFDWSGRLRWSVRGLRTGDRMGASLSGAADFDDDGSEEIAAGAPGASAGAGAVVLLRADGAVLDVLAGPTGAAFGRVVASPGDLDHDGAPDLVVGAERLTWPGEGRPGTWITFPGAGSSQGPFDVTLR